MSNHPVNFFEIVSDDPARLRSFYSDLFGWRIQVDEDGYGLVDTGAGENGVGENGVGENGVGENGVGGGIGPKTSPEDAAVKIYMRTDSLEDTVARAQELGSTVYLPPMDLPGDYGRIAIVSDPDGNPVGLWS
ncbi:VOC family protein [Microbacterium neungamense]|uniref:VOC family protein n=1 Tax=Microbacterium neungamense TaxID=2810535 RepID=UPI00217DB755|nr:VOC family protein [Microbacterium neungamense]UWF76813.1 VOC family protein [Microbacterium neungamense]